MSQILSPWLSQWPLWGIMHPERGRQIHNRHRGCSLWRLPSKFWLAVAEQCLALVHVQRRVRIVGTRSIATHTCLSRYRKLYHRDWATSWGCWLTTRDQVPRIRVCLDVIANSVNTRWRRCIGCLTLQVFFRKRTTNYKALLRKITYKEKASYDSTPPCTMKRYPLNLTCTVMCGVVCRT